MNHSLGITSLEYKKKFIPFWKFLLFKLGIFYFYLFSTGRLRPLVPHGSRDQISTYFEKLNKIH